MRIGLALMGAVLLCSEPALAARIYNFIAVPIHVMGITERITIAPGQRSDSLSWSTSNSVGVFVTPRMLSVCAFFFGPHAEITGGHYMIVSSQGTNVSCVLCDSDHHVMHRAGERAPKEVWDELLKNPSRTTGC
ncbi:MAG TPA: hypothetical protein VNF68_02010 [Candidatus Baltobacteraceae bacterium]|nr:hypothetical protein [Candidatus Baltobacteraceae bacterium]